MKKSPLEQVKQSFQDKAGLVAAVKALATEDLWLSRVNEDKGLDSVSNSKLLKLHSTLSELKTKFGTRSAIIGEIVKLAKREGDGGYKLRLEKFTTPRLWDTYKSLHKASKSAN